MTRKELIDIICPLNFVYVGMPQWFFDLECNFRLWVPHFKAFSINSCHSRILRLLRYLTQEKNCTMSGPY